MKKLIALLFFACTFMSISAQNNIHWLKIDNNKDKYDFKYYIKASMDSYKAVFTIPQNKPFQATKHSIFIRNYDKNMDLQTEMGIPAESPVTLAIKGFQDYNVIYGTMDENNNPMSQYAEANRIVIADNSMNPLVTKDFPLHGKNHKFAGSPDIILSHDSSHMIVVNMEILSPDKLSLKAAPVMHYIDVYDKDLKLVWSDSVNFDQVFGEKASVGIDKMDYINNKLVITASSNADKMKKTVAAIYVVVADKPQSYKIIMNKVFDVNSFSYKTLFSKDGKVIFSGVCYAGPAGPFSNSNPQQLFYLSKDVLNPDAEEVYRNYDINKTLVPKFPEHKKWLGSSIREPFELLLINGKLIYCSEQRIESTSYSSSGHSSSTTYYIKHITLVKFDTDGEIEWLQMINKNFQTKVNPADVYCKAFAVGENLCIFYYDWAENIVSAKFVEKPHFSMDNKLWVARAIVTPDGTIQKAMITNTGEYKIGASLYKTIKVNDTRFLMIGTGTSLQTQGNYFGFYDLD